MQFSAISSHPYNNVLAGCLSNEENGNKLMVKGQDCKLGAATNIHPNFVTALVWCTWFVLPGILIEAQHF
jgi:hypothetical protein